MSREGEFRGLKYSDTLSTVQVAALVRGEIKAAIKAGTLPKGIKVSVRARSFAGGSSIDVSIKAFPGLTLNPARVFADSLMVWEQTTRFLHSKEVNAAARELEEMLNAFKRDNSDSSVDYFDVNFYGSVDVRTDTVGERAALLESAELADLRVAKAAGQNLEAQLNAYDANPRWTYTDGVGHLVTHGH